MIGTEPAALSHSLNSTNSTDRSSDEIDPGLISISSRLVVNALLIAFNVSINELFLGFVGNCIFGRIVKARPINIECRALLIIVSMPVTLGKILRTSSSDVFPSEKMHNTFL